MRSAMGRILALLALLILMASAQSAFVVHASEDWPQYRANSQNTGTANNTAPKSDQLVWSVKLAGPTTSSPIVADKKVFIGDSNGTVWAFDAFTGNKVWSFHTNASVESSPTYYKGQIFVGSDDDNIYSLNASTGQLRWSFKTGSTVKSSASIATLTNVSSKPKDILVIGSYDAKLYAIDIDGHQLWNFTAASFIHGKPGISNGMAFTCTCDKTMYGVDLETGNKQLAIPFQDYSAASPSVVNGLVYSTGRNGRIFTVSIAEKTIKWDYNLNQTVESSPAVGSGLVVVGGNNGDVVALNDATGQKVWSLKAAGGVSSSAAIVNGNIYFGDSSGDLYEISAQTGKAVWTFKADGGISSSPAVASGLVYFGTESGKLYAIGDMKPIVRLIQPIPWVHIDGQLHVRFEATGDGLSKVEVGVDGSNWKPAKQINTGQITWGVDIDTTKLKNGEHLIGARATNATGTGEDSLYVIVDNPKVTKKPFIPGFDLPMVIGVTIFITVIIRLASKRDHKDS